MTEHPGSLLNQLLRERYPDANEVRAEAHRPVPDATHLPHLPPVESLGETCGRTLETAGHYSAEGMSA